MLQHPKVAQECDDSVSSRQCVGSILVQSSVSFVSDDCLQSVRHRTDEILQSGQRNWSPRFPKTTFECRQCLRLRAGINSCSHNAPNVFNRRQIWRIWRPISRWNVTSDICYCAGVGQVQHILLASGFWPCPVIRSSSYRCSHTT